MLDENEAQLALNLAKNGLKKQLEGLNIDYGAPNVSPESELLKPLGCFVTLKRNGNLRGCIGSIVSEEPLYLNIIRNAINAGLRDPRFPPVTLEEFDTLEWELSVMGPLAPCTDLDDIEIGLHGLFIELENHRGLLLPQVAVEWGWDRKTFLEHLCLKAGLPKDEYLKKRAKVSIFRADIYPK